MKRRYECIMCSDVFLCYRRRLFAHTRKIRRRHNMWWARLSSCIQANKIMSKCKMIFSLCKHATACWNQCMRIFRAKYAVCWTCNKITRFFMLHKNLYISCWFQKLFRKQPTVAAVLAASIVFANSALNNEMYINSHLLLRLHHNYHTIKYIRRFFCIYAWKQEEKRTYTHAFQRDFIHFHLRRGNLWRKISVEASWKIHEIWRNKYPAVMGCRDWFPYFAFNRNEQNYGFLDFLCFFC